jgi:hypothetical protein
MNHHSQTGDRFTIENCTIERETERAILVSHDDTAYWIPLSQVHEIHRTKQKGADSIVMSGWIADQKGLR